MLQGCTDRFFGFRLRPLVPLALPSGEKVDAGEDQRQLGRAHFDRHGITGDDRNLKRAAFEPLEADVMMPPFWRDDHPVARTLSRFPRISDRLDGVGALSVPVDNRSIPL